MIRELVLERTAQAERQAIGMLGAPQDICPPGCCVAPEPAQRHGASRRPVGASAEP
jgi:hypothetical protein